MTEKSKVLALKILNWIQNQLNTKKAMSKNVCMILLHQHT